MRRSSTWVRSSIARNASARLAPMRVSCSIRRDSSESGPGTAAAVRSRACSKPRPASTEITSRSSVSGSRRSISSRRRVMRPSRRMSGPKMHTPEARITTRIASSGGFRGTAAASPIQITIDRDAEHLQHQEAVDLVAGRASREHDLALDVVDVADGREPAGEVREPVGGRRQHPGADRLLPSPRHALSTQLVVVDRPQRTARPECGLRRWSTPTRRRAPPRRPRAPR